MRTTRATKQHSGGFQVAYPVLWAIFLFLASASGVLAQQTTGRIFGTILDTQGASVPNAQVTITNQDTGVVREVVSGSDGFYNAPQIAAGKYTISAMAPGFAAIQERDVEVTVATERRVDLKLTVGSVQQTVTVSGTNVLVDTSSSSIQSTVSEQKVADLPLNGRNWVSLITLQPGVTQTNLYSGNAVLPGANGTIYSSNGGTLRSNFYSLDGANMSTLVGFNSSSMTNSSLGIDGIKEFTVVTSMFSAEYGLRMGSQTVIVSKGGSNAFHGDAFEYLRNSSLDARNYFDATDKLDVNGCGTDKSIVYPCKRIPPYRRNDFGGAFGGPIRKDKTFFYAVYEGIRSKQGQSITTNTLPAGCFVNGVVPAIIANNGCVAGSATTPITVNSYILPLARLFPAPNISGYPTFNFSFPFVQPSSENYGQIRLDQVFSPKDTFFLRYTVDYASNLAPVPTGAYPGFALTEPSYSHFITFSESHTFSPTLLNTARLSYSRTYENVNNQVDPSLNQPDVLVVPGTYVPNISPGSGVTALGTLCCPTSAAQDIWTFSDDVYWTKGKHSLRLGASLNWFLMYPDAHNFFQSTLAFSNLSSFFNGIYSNITVEKPGSQTAFSQRMQTYGFYVQDDYRISSRLTLNLGLRYEPGTVPRDRNPARRYTIVDPLTDTTGTQGPLWLNNTWQNVSPRLGFAWDVTGKGTTSIKGGTGIYYDLGSFTSIPLVQGISNPPISENLQILNTSLTPNPPFTVPLVISPNQPLSPREPQYDLHEPLMVQYNLTIQQQLPWQMALTASYIGSQAQHLFQVRNANYVIPVGEADGLPVDGCWNAAKTSYVLPGANGACALGFSSIGARINPAFGVFQLNQSEGRSYYNSLQINLNKHLTHGLLFQFAYTYAKLLDTGQGEFSSESPTELTQFNNLVSQRLDRGPASFDVRHNLRANAIYQLPSFNNGNKFVRGIANGWWLSTIVSAQSGFPITPQLGSDRALAGDTYAFLRPDIGPSFNASTVVEGKVSQWFNPTMFSLPPAGTYGDAGRGILRGPGLFNTDFSVVKDTKAPFLGEAGVVEFRAEIFNLLNHANFALPVATVWSSATPSTVAAGPIGSPGIAAFGTAGQISSTVTNSRQIQLALKLMF